MDKAGKEYWDDCWADGTVQNAVNPHLPKINNYINRRFHEYFSKAFGGLETCGMKLLEIGCARSSWLPYFANEFGFNVSGLDYSEIGCKMAQKILDREKVKGPVYCENFFAPTELLKKRFDVVVSFGVVEHFHDTAKCITAVSKFLKPGGLIFTNIPNMLGIMGYVQKIINRPVFDIHVPLDRFSLCKAHQKAGLEILDCDYFTSINFGVLNLNGIPVNTLDWFFKRIITKMLARFSIAVWFAESKLGIFNSTKLMSPYINCVALKK